MRRTLVVAPLLALLAITLTGCDPTPGGAPAPHPTSTSTSTSPSSPAPTGSSIPVEEHDEDDNEITRILIVTDTVYFGDDIAWAVDGFRYEDPHEQAIAKLTAVFGEEPVSDPVDSGGGQISEAYWWGGDAFLLYFYSGAGEYPTTMAVQVSAASVNGITIETGDGVHVGSPWADAVAAADNVRPTDDGEDGRPLTEARFDVRPTGRPNEYDCVVVYGRGGPVTTIVAPARVGELPGY
jgi:hypothetical protein